MVRLIAFLAARTRRALTAAPNAGQPRIERGRVRYECAPPDFLRAAETLAENGVAVVAGCCGTGPEHIRALAAALRGRTVVARPPPVAAGPAVPAGEPGAIPPRASPVRERMRSARPLVSVEIRAERSRSLEEIVSRAARLAEAGADFFDVPDNPGASVGRDAMVTAARLQSELRVPAIPHLAATQSNLLRAHSLSIGAGDLGLSGVLAVTGDAPSMGPLGAWAHRVSDLRSSVELLRLLRDLREGRLVSGERVADPPNFCAGCAFGQPVPGQLRWLRSKIEAGAEFVFTQPVFTPEAYAQLRDALAETGARVFYGLLPLIGARGAAALAGGRLPGLSVPAEVVEDLARFPDPADQRRRGLERAGELAARIAAEGRDVYLIPPFGRDGAAAAVDILRAIRAARRPA
jgi:homocysteine S-methyltransferase